MRRPPEPHDKPGYLLGPGSISWKMMRERVLLLGAGRMLLMQMGEASVAAGVEQFSDYLSDPWARVRHTTDFYLRLVHAQNNQVPELRRYLAHAHKGISGRTPAGSSFSAESAQLMLWVHATVADSVLWSYQQVFGELSRSDISRYWSEQRIIALALGIEPQLVPSGASSWRSYIDRVTSGLEVSEGTIEVWGLICRMPDQGPRRLPRFIWRRLRRTMARAVCLATRAGMPPGLREGLGCRFTSDDLARWRRLCRCLCLALPLVPPELRLSARARAAQSAVAPPRLASRWS